MGPAPDAAPTRTRASAGALAVILLSLGITLSVGAAIRAPCADLGGFFRPDLAHRLCYTDVVALYADRDLHDRFPYLDAGNEYPVGTGLLMGFTAIPANDESRYLLINELVLGLAALAIAVMLHRLVGIRALFFTAAPALAVYSFLNWDLAALALGVGSTALFLRRRDVGAGALLGLGAATKVFPGLLAPGFVLDRIREGRRRSALAVAAASAVAWIVSNAPVAAMQPTRWSLFFRFNSERAVDPATLWGLGCSERFTGLCPAPGPVNALSLAAFVGAAAFVWTARRRSEPDFPRWTFGLALVALFLLTNKVYSPQYGLWLLPWFALVLPDVRLFVIWSVVDTATWAATLASVRQVPGFEGPPIALVKALVVARALVLIWILASYVRRPSQAEPSTIDPGAETPAP